MNRAEIETKVAVLRQLESKIAQAKAVLNVSVKAYKELHDELLSVNHIEPQGEMVTFPKRDPLLEVTSRDNPVIDRKLAIKLIKQDSELVELISFGVVKADIPAFNKHKVKLGHKYSAAKITKIM